MIGPLAGVDPLVIAAPVLVLVLGGLSLMLHQAIAETRFRRRRLQTALGVASGRDPSRRDAQGEKARLRQIETTLREMAEKQQARARREAPNTLASRMKQAGLDWSRGRYVAVSILAGAVGVLFAVGAAGLPVLPALGFGVAFGFIGPHLFVGMKRGRRTRAFMGEMPDALDVIVRGVRSGLPLNDCLRMIAAEGREPLRTEFRQFVEDLAVGLTVEDAGARMFERVPLLEVKLLGIILNIQSRAGGNLSEAIGNLSRVLRDRRKMKGKIKAMATEATASAAIIGSLPIIVTGLLYATAPDYVGLLFTTTMGNIALAGGGTWMLIGVLVMRGMINFEV
jgi:tight adherence protein B